METNDYTWYVIYHDTLKPFVEKRIQRKYVLINKMVRKKNNNHNGVLEIETRILFLLFFFVFFLIKVETLFVLWNGEVYWFLKVQFLSNDSRVNKWCCLINVTMKISSFFFFFSIQERLQKEKHLFVQRSNGIILHSKTR